MINEEFLSCLQSYFDIGKLKNVVAFGSTYALFVSMYPGALINCDVSIEIAAPVDREMFIMEILGILWNANIDCPQCEPFA